MALWLALQNFRSNWAKNIVWAFTIFYGFTFVISVDNATSDVNRYISSFKAMSKVNVSYAEFTNSLYNVKTQSADVLQPLVTFLVSRITSQGAVLLATFGFIFGYFYSRNIWMLLERLNGALKPLTVIFLIVFALIVPIWYLNGFRFWAAAHIFLFGSLTYLLKGKKRGISIAFLSGFVHFSFLLPVVILVVYLLLGNRLTFFFCFFIISFFVNELNVGRFNKLAQTYLPEVFVEKANPYTTEENVEVFKNRASDNKNWYALLYKKTLGWSVIILLSMMFFRGRKIIERNETWLKLFSFTLIFYGIANIISMVPSGVRFITVANLFSIVMIILYIHNMRNDLIFKRVSYLLLPLLSLFIIVVIRDGFSSFGIFTVLGNPLVAIILGGGGDTALIDLVKLR